MLHFRYFEVKGVRYCVVTGHAGQGLVQLQLGRDVIVRVGDDDGNNATGMLKGTRSRIQVIALLSASLIHPSHRSVVRNRVVIGIHFDHIVLRADQNAVRDADGVAGVDGDVVGIVGNRNKISL